VPAKFWGLFVLPGFGEEHFSFKGQIGFVEKTIFKKIKYVATGMSRQ